MLRPQAQIIHVHPKPGAIFVQLRDLVAGKVLAVCVHFIHESIASEVNRFRERLAILEHLHAVLRLRLAATTRIKQGRKNARICRDDNGIHVAMSEGDAVLVLERFVKSGRIEVGVAHSVSDLRSCRELAVSSLCGDASSR